MVIPGLSMDGHGYSGIRGYSDKGGEGWTSLDYPWMVTVTLASADTLTRGGGGGGGGGWSSLDYPWTVTVTLASADTLTRGGEGGHPWTIHGWSELLWHPRIL